MYSRLCFPLFGTHTGFYNIYYIIAQFFTFADNVHIHGTYRIGVLVTVDVVDILALQLIAVVIDFVFDVEGTVGIQIILTSAEQNVHLGKTVVGEFKHLMDMFYLLLGEFFFAFQSSVDSTCHIVTTVADTFYLGYLTEHGTYLRLRFNTQVGITHVIQIIGYLYLHIITDVLVFLDTGEEFYESGLVFDLKQFTYKNEHTLDTLTEVGYFFLCLQYRQLRGLHKTTSDEAQTEVVFILSLTRFDNLASRIKGSGGISISKNIIIRTHLKIVKVFHCFILIIKYKFIHHMRYPVLFVRIRNIVGGILYLQWSISHCHAQSGIIYHTLVVVSVTARYHLLFADADCLDQSI